MNQNTTVKVRKDRSIDVDSLTLEQLYRALSKGFRKIRIPVSDKTAAPFH
jgi:hypothetical protein